MTRQTRHSVLGALAAMMALSTAAWAGTKSGYTVAISISGGTGAASGSMGNTRNSADTLQYIGCSVTTIVTATSIEVSRTLTCSARNTSNITVACTSTDPSLIDMVHSINSDSYIRFAWGEDGSCTSLKISTYSHYAPKEL